MERILEGGDVEPVSVGVQLLRPACGRAGSGEVLRRDPGRVAVQGGPCSR